MTTKSKDHATLQYREAPAPKRPWIPRPLRNISVLQIGLPQAEEQRLYGVWPMKAIRHVRLCGVDIYPGETFKAAGNAGLNLVFDNPNGPDAEFLDVDGRRKREEDLEAAAKELGAPVDYQKEAAFGADFPDVAQPKRKPWGTV